MQHTSSNRDALVNSDRHTSDNTELLPLKESTNVLLLSRLAELKFMSFVNVSIAIATIVYIGVNITCIILNGYDNDDWPVKGAVSKAFFHNLEFWATFIFSILEVFALVYSPKPLGAIYQNTLLLKLVIFVNIVISFLGAMLVAVNLEKFEVPAHEMEYSNELTMALFDLIILVSLIRSKSGARITSQGSNATNAVIICIAILVAIVQLAVYNGMGVDPDGERPGEQAAHYCEFGFEILSASVTFWFCMDNKICADEQVLLIMLSDERDIMVRIDRGDAPPSAKN